MGHESNPASSVTVEVIKEPAALEAMKDEWDRLLFKGHTRTVELSHEWQTVFWENFYDGKAPDSGKSGGRYPTLFVVAARESGRLVGVAPLMISLSWKNGFPGRILEFIAGIESNYQDFVVDPEVPGVLEAMIECLFANRDLWDMMYLRNVPENSPTLDFLKNGGFGRSCHGRVVQRKRTISLSISGTWDDFAGTMSSKSRRRIRNGMRRLQKTGDIRTFHCSTEEEFLDYMKKFFELHRRKWNRTDTPSNFNDARFRNFYLDVIHRLFPKKHVDLYVMETGDAPIGMIFSFLLENGCLMQLTIYNTDFEKQSPSIIMHDRFVEESFDGRIDVLDFGDHYTFKEMWGRDSHYKVSMEFYPRETLRSLALFCATKVAEPVRGLLRMIKPLRRMVIRKRQDRAGSSPVREA